jgi:hypothetical protein
VPEDERASPPQDCPSQTNQRQAALAPVRRFQPLTQPPSRVGLTSAGNDPLDLIGTVDPRKLAMAQHIVHVRLYFAKSKAHLMRV